MISFSSVGAPGYGRAILVAVCLCLAVMAYGKASANEPEDPSDRKDMAQAAQPERYVYFNNFIIYQTDKPDRARILVCDVTVELNQGTGLSKEKIELRKIIYNLLKYHLDVIELNEISRNKIKAELNNVMNTEIIKNVYFTKFFLL